MNNSITPAFTIGSSASSTPNHDVRTSHVQSSSHPVFISHPVNVVGGPLYGQEEPTIPPASKAAFNTAALTAEDIQAFVQKAINGEESRKYKINSPPTNRPVRVYADGRLRYLFLPTPLCSLRQHDRRVWSLSLRVRLCSVNSRIEIIKVPRVMLSSCVKPNYHSHLCIS